MPSDVELLDKYRQTNDAAAFAELTRRYRAMVFVTARRITGDSHDAEDVAQSCFLDLARRAPQITSAVSGYLHSAATSYARNVVRDRSRRKKRENRAASEYIERTHSREPSERPWEELAPEIDAAIESLPEKFRIPIILFYLRGMTDAEIAVELGLSRSRVVGRLQVAVRRLRANLTQGGGAISVTALLHGLKSASLGSVPPSLVADLGRMALAGISHGPVPIKPNHFRWRAKLIPLTISRFRLWIGAGAVLAGGISLFLFLYRPYEKPYDRLQAIYRPYMPSTFDWRTASMTQNPMMFWRGSQPLFFDWCKSHCADWLGDSDNVVLCDADPYLPDARTIPDEIETSNSARLPFQIELLQAMVGQRVLDGRSEDPARFDVDREMFDAYRNAMSLHRNMQAPAYRVAPDAEELSRLENPAGGLRRITYSNAGNVDEIIEPMADVSAVADSVSQAMANNPQFASLFAGSGREWIASHVAAAGVRTHIKAAASQGLFSLLVLMHSPLKASGGDVLIELHETIPSAAELAGTIEKDARPPAQRAAEDALVLAPASLPMSWCEFDGKSMLVRFHKPPTGHRAALADESSLPADWATASAMTHDGNPDRDRIVALLTPGLLQQLSDRADAYMGAMQRDRLDFNRDPRCDTDSKTVNADVSSALAAAYQAAQIARRNKQ